MLEDLFRASPEKIQAMLGRLRAMAESLGLPFGDRTRTYNSRLAQELGLWAEDQGMGHPFHMAVFRAYFEGGQNLAKTEVLINLAECVGLAKNQAEAVLNDRTYSENVDRDWQESREKGITAVPTFVMGQNALVGAQPYEALVNLLSVNGISRKGGS